LLLDFGEAGILGVELNADTVPSLAGLLCGMLALEFVAQVDCAGNLWVTRSATAARPWE
jgi:hypothetical protein